MATFEERLQAVEQDNAKLKQDNAELRQKIELQTIAIGGLVNKTVLDQVNNKNDKIFQALMKHDDFTNRQLAEFRAELSELHVTVDVIDGKIVGMRTEVRQSFAEINARFETMATKDDLNAVKSDVGTLKSDVGTLKSDVGTLKSDVGEIKVRLETVDTNIAQILQILTTLTQKPDQEK